MIHAPGLLLTIAAFALVIGPLIFVHEMGHYLAGRLFGVKADAFSIGFGREIAGWTDKRGTRWKLSLLPLGGYVKFAGDMNVASQTDAAWLSLPAAERARTFPAKPVWQRAIIVAAGPFVNLALAVLILAGFAYAYGEDVTPAAVGGVAANSAAAKAGLRTGDRIVSLGGRDMPTFIDVAQFAMLRPGETIDVAYMRGGALHHVDATIGAVVAKDRFGNESRVGRFGIAPPPPVGHDVSLVEAPAVGAAMVVDILRAQAEGITQIIVGRLSVKELGGPIKIAKYSGEQLALGWGALLWFAAMISINLGFINLLPLPILDGGHLFFYAIEAIRRRPVEPQVQEWAFRGGLAVILALMLFVTFNDLAQFGVWKNLAGLIG